MAGAPQAASVAAVAYGIRLYNSLTRRTEPFEPREPGRVRIYHCGPTVYRRQHIGNLRRYLFADLLRRSLELAGYAVYEVMNITDVGHLTQDDLDAGEDKMEVSAREHHTTPGEIAKQQTALFLADLKALNVQPAHVYPRATDHIQQMQALIRQLLQRGYAYKTKSGVYFSVRSFPSYGQLSGNTLARLTAVSRIPVRDEKRDPADFALWKIDDAEHLQQWDSPWGQGYPGWHIECSAMSRAYLGHEIDIHTGGEDNRFPHHENEMAQSEAASGARFVRWWMHNAHLRFAGAKLAKRSGVQLTLDTVRERGFSPLAFRLLVFGTHYRQAINFSWKALAGAEQNLSSLKQLTRRVAAAERREAEAAPEGTVIDGCREALADDLNSPVALARVMGYVHQANELLERGSHRRVSRVWATLLAVDHVLGIFGRLYDEVAAEVAPLAILSLVEAREVARRSKDFTTADALRKQIEQGGWLLEDTPAGPRVRPR